MRDLWQRRVTSGTATLKPVAYAAHDAGRLWTHITPQLPPRCSSGWFSLTGTVVTGDNTYDLARAHSVAVLPERRDQLAAIRNPFLGMSAVYPFSETRQSVPRFSDRTAAIIRAIGVSAIRFWIHWDQLQPHADARISWQKGDQLVKTARRHNLNVLGVVVGTPSFALANPQNSNATRPAAFAPRRDIWRAFLHRLVTRYRTDIEFWEIWNEPNGKAWQDSDAAFADLVNLSYRTIKEIAPEATVVLGGTTGAKSGWIKRVLTARPDVHADALGVHPYRYPQAPPEYGSDRASKGYGAAPMLEDLANVSALLPQLHSASHAELWATEAGYSTYGMAGRALHAPVSEKKQAELMLRMLLLSRAAGVKRFFWHKLTSTFGGGMGLFDHPYHQCAPKPAAIAYAVFAWMTRNNAPVELVEAGQKATVHVCHTVAPENDSYRLLIAWSLNKGTALALPRASVISLTNMTGGTESLRAGSSSEQAVVPLSESPLYIQTRGDPGYSIRSRESGQDSRRNR